jgi:hypothetical protein
MSNISGIVKSARRIMRQDIGIDRNNDIETELTQNENFQLR